jgi:DNA-binding PucR family transcriptional regulator
MMQAVEDQFPSAGHAELREQLSNMQGLLMLSMLMTQSGEEFKILHLAATSVRSFGRYHVVGVYFGEGGWRETAAHRPSALVRAEMEAQLGRLGRSEGAIAIAGDAWGWALPLRSLDGDVGYFIVGAAEEPPPSEQFLLRVLVQHTAEALSRARLHAKEQATAEELRATNAALTQTVRALQQATQIHGSLTRVAVDGGGQEGVARTVHELTGYPVAVEDRYGNLRAWAGPGEPDPYPKVSPDRRQQMLLRAQREGRPIRDGGRLIALAGPGADILGVLALVDPEETTGDREQTALEHGATVLAMELARQRGLAEAELRLRRDLVEELLSGTDEESALARANALGYDLQLPHRVVAVGGEGHTHDEDVLLHAVRRAARATNVGGLVATHGGAIVVLADADVSLERFRAAVLTELGGGRCRVGVGGLCAGPGDIPRSWREARLALKMQRSATDDDRVTCFEDLGVYRVLSEVEDPETVERLVRQWLGPLLDYDSRKHADLVATLSQYLESGGSYDATADALSIARSTLRYRLQRIREISGHDLADPDTSFNLHFATRAWRTLESLRA